MPDAVSIVKEIYIKQFSTNIHTVTNGTSDEFNVSFTKNRRITHIGIAFLQPAGLIKTSPSDFSAGYKIVAAGGNPTVAEAYNTGTANPLESLSCLRILCAGSTYPTPDYNLQFNNYNVNSNFESSNNQSNDLFRAYYDFIVNSDSLRDRAGALLNLKVGRFNLFSSLKHINHQIMILMIVWLVHSLIIQIAQVELILVL